MRWIRIGGAAALLAVALACGGMSAMMPSGGVKTGADAVRPAGFPLPEPPGGTLDTTVEFGVAGVTTVTLQYKLPEGDDAELIDLYEKSMDDAGLETTRTGAPEPATVTGTSPDQKSVWNASIGHEDSQRTLTLVVVTQ
jgi:hypothetical protein